MAKTTFHFVGEAGTRKTTLAVALARSLSGGAPWRKCLLVTEGLPLWFDPLTGDFEPGKHAYDLQAAIERADVAMVEHFPGNFSGGNPGDVVVYTSIVSAPQALTATETVAHGVVHA